MQLVLVLPGLLWPSPGATGLTAGLALPSLETLLGFARTTASPPRPFESSLAHAFGLPPDDVPVAALRRLGERDDSPVDGQWICADPVHLQVTREHLLLSDADDLGLSAAEAGALLEGLNEYFLPAEPDFVRFEARSSRRWYLRLKTPARVVFSPLGEVVGRPVAGYMPRGDEAARWSRIINEGQVLLHNHPINQARAAAGKPTVNSLWFWGAGALPERVTPPAPIVRGEDRLTCGLARAAGIRPDGLTGRLPTQDAFIVVDTLLRPSLHLDIDRWRTGLVDLEARWFKPLLSALRSRRLSKLRIRIPGERASLELDIGRFDLLKLWRKPRTLESLSQAIS